MLSNYHSYVENGEKEKKNYTSESVREKTKMNYLLPITVKDIILLFIESKVLLWTSNIEFTALHSTRSRGYKTETPPYHNNKTKMMKNSWTNEMKQLG